MLRPALPRPARPTSRWTTRVLTALTMLGAVGVATAAAASAHGFTSVVFADVTEPGPDVVRTELGLEYDLLVVSAADQERDDLLFQEGTAALEDGDATAQASALQAHADTVLAYVGERFVVASAGAACTPRWAGDVRVEQREGVPYALVTLDHACADPGAAHELTSSMFADDEGYVTGTTTIVTYDLDGASGSAALGAEQSSFSTAQSGWQRFVEFFVLGGEHLLFGLDHVLFLLAVIVGSRRLREIVLTATAFTVAHSITFVLAATGVVHVPGEVVEPVIALSIAVVAGWHLWGVRVRGDGASEPGGRAWFGLDRPGWVRIGVVLLFGLVHGLGFAGALGIDEPWSWTLLWSLLVFNVGIEAVQLAIIAVVFPVLALLRRRAPTAGAWVTGTSATGVAAMGLVWFVQRLWGA